MTYVAENVFGLERGRISRKRTGQRLRKQGARGECHLPKDERFLPGSYASHNPQSVASVLVIASETSATEYARSRSARSRTPCGRAARHDRSGVGKSLTSGGSRLICESSMVKIRGEVFDYSEAFSRNIGLLS